MGRFAREAGRRSVQVVSFEIPRAAMPRLERWADPDRLFSMRQLLQNEVTDYPDMVIGAIRRIGDRRCTRSEAISWWERIGPRARDVVTMCFERVHNLKISVPREGVDSRP